MEELKERNKGDEEKEGKEKRREERREGEKGRDMCCKGMCKLRN